jgi:hypothetical protein
LAAFEQYVGGPLVKQAVALADPELRCRSLLAATLAGIADCDARRVLDLELRTQDSGEVNGNLPRAMTQLLASSNLLLRVMTQAHRIVRSARNSAGGVPQDRPADLTQAALGVAALLSQDRQGSSGA